MTNKYSRNIKGVEVDVYDVLKAFEVTDPALQHLIKKALATGRRGHKTFEQDLKDILESAKRAVELNKVSFNIDSGYFKVCSEPTSFHHVFPDAFITNADLELREVINAEISLSMVHGKSQTPPLSEK